LVQQRLLVLCERRKDFLNRHKIAVLHDVLHVGGVLNVLERVAGNDDEIGDFARLEGERSGGSRGS
jgi:hypothetical protein